MANLDNADKRFAGLVLDPGTYFPNGGTPPVGMYESFFRATQVGIYLPGGGIAPPAPGTGSPALINLGGDMSVGGGTAGAIVQVDRPIGSI